MYIREAVTYHNITNKNCILLVLVIHQNKCIIIIHCEVVIFKLIIFLKKKKKRIRSQRKVEDINIKLIKKDKPKKWPKKEQTLIKKIIIQKVTF